MEKDWSQKAEENREFARKKMEEFAKSYQENPETIVEYLRFSKNFHQYSQRNTALIYQQNPHATFVKSFAGWKKEGVSVNRGEKGIAIWYAVQSTLLKREDGSVVSLRNATKEEKDLYKKGELEGVVKQGFQIGYVFDIAQTNFPKEQYPKYFDMGQASEDADKMIAALESYAENELQCSVRTEDLSSISLKGYYYKNGIVLNEKLEGVEKLSTLSHEMGHAIEKHGVEGKEKGEGQREYEADCISIMLQDYLGIEITDARRRHFKHAYNQFEKEMQEKYQELPLEAQKREIERGMNDSFEHIHRVMGKHLNQIEEYMKNPDIVQQRNVQNISAEHKIIGIEKNMRAGKGLEI